MRGSIHLLPRDTAHLPFRALQETPAGAEKRMRYFKLTPERYAELREAVLAVAVEPRTAAELKKLVGAGEEWQGALGTMTREGALVRIGAEGLRSNILRYVVPKPQIEAAEPGEALAWLAGEYLRAYGPARRQDFAWWTGAPPKVADAALATVETEELDGGLLLRRADREAFERAQPPRGVDLLPKWDMLTMGYPKDGRARFAHDDVAGRCYDFRGDGMALVLVDGEAIAAWTSRFAGRRMEVELDWFEQPAKRAKAAIDEAFEDVAKLLGASSVSGV